MPKLQRIEDVLEPVVGCFYDVPLAVVELWYSKKIIKVPIHDNLHADPQFNGAGPHYHIDGRFAMSKGCQREYHLQFGRTNYAIFQQGGQYQILGIKRAKRKLVSLDTGLNHYDFTDTSKYTKWYHKQVGKSCKGGKCPHYGVQMQLKGDKWYCPLHNLVGCAKTNKILPYSIEHHA